MIDRLTQDQANKVTAAFQERGVRMDCASCGSAGSRSMLTALYSVQNAMTEDGLHAVATVCQVCGNLQLHALRRMGLDGLADELDAQIKRSMGL